MPFVVVNVSPEQFTDVQSSFAGHDVVKHVGEWSYDALHLGEADRVLEEDKEMKTQ